LPVVPLTSPSASDVCGTVWVIPFTTVVVSAGKTKGSKPQVLDSYTLWHNKADGR
jgi:hypothetical protein